MWPRRHVPRIRPTLQETSADCAYACLAMVLAGFGSRVSLEVIKRRVPPSASGTSLSQLLQLASGFGLSAQPLRASLTAMPALRLPAMLHWDMNHFVVLASISAGRFEVLDPARGRLILTENELSDHFTGIAIQFQTMPEYQRLRQVVRSSISDLWSTAAGIRRSVAVVIALALVSQMLILVTPLFYSLAINRGLTGSQGLLVAIIGAATVANLLIAAGDLTRRCYVVHLGTEVSRQTTSNIINHLLRLPYLYFQHRRLGDLTTRVESTRFLRDALTDGALSVLIDGAFCAIALSLLSVFCPGVAIICTIAAACYLTFKYFAQRRFRALEAETFHSQAIEQGVAMECLRGVLSIKTLGIETARAAAWAGANAESLQRTRDIQMFSAVMAAGKSAISALELVFVMAYCMVKIRQGQMGVGTLFALLALRQLLQDRIYPLLEKIFDFDILRLRMARLQDITFQAPDPAHEATPEPFPIGKGHIELADLVFRYEEDAPAIVDGLNLHIGAGEFVAIKGLSGAGKSTFIKLLIGLLPAEKGTITVDGIALAPGNLSAYKTHLGVVLQNDELFSGTILDNITAFESDADLEQVRAAARLAQVDGDIEAMKMGYFSLIGDMGSSLSGGQRQRLLLARAIYRRPKIFVLDEGTANLDPEREHAVIEAIRSLGVTVVSVAHRSKTLDLADRVLEFREGQLFEAVHVKTNHASGRSDPLTAVPA